MYISTPSCIRCPMNVSHTVFKYNRSASAVNYSGMYIATPTSLLFSLSVRETVYIFMCISASPYAGRQMILSDTNAYIYIDSMQRVPQIRNLNRVDAFKNPLKFISRINVVDNAVSVLFVLDSLFAVILGLCVQGFKFFEFMVTDALYFVRLIQRSCYRHSRSK